MDVRERALFNVPSSAILSISPSARAFNQQFAPYLGSEIWVWVRNGELTSVDGSIDSNIIRLGLQTGAIEISAIMGSTAFLRIKPVQQPIRHIETSRAEAIA